MRALAVVLILVVLGVTVAVAAGWGDRMVSVPVDRAPSGLDPQEPVRAQDVAGLRFNLALRGYRMDEVDEVLTLLAAALADRDERISELEQSVPGVSPDLLPDAQDPEPLTETR